jgi:endonuclease/exonuclease/phosphatase family metal-dependent hydrolase
MPLTRTRRSPLPRPLAAVPARAAVLLLTGWAAGCIFTDRFLWSQFLWWMPSPLVALIGALLLAVSTLGGRGHGRAAARPRRAGAVLLIACIGHLLVSDLGLLRIAGRPVPGPALKLLNWNVTWITDRAAVLKTILEADADVTVLVNPHTGVGWNELFGEIPYPYALLYRDGIIVISKYPIHHFGSAWLGIEGLPAPAPSQTEDATQRPRRDPGRALWFDVDARATLGRSFTVWTVDLPSEPRLSRWMIAGEAREAIESWPGPRLLRDEEGRYTRDPASVHGFPAPDVVMGDLNITRGSASLRRLAPGAHNAYADAGLGWSASVPRRFPLVHIDQVLLGPDLRAGRYRVFDPGIGHHDAQVAEILPR